MMKKQKDSAEKAIRDIRRAMARVSRVSSSLVGGLDPAKPYRESIGSADVDSIQKQQPSPFLRDVGVQFSLADTA
jgi:hypothetical protein